MLNSRQIYRLASKHNNINVRIEPLDWMRLARILPADSIKAAQLLRTGFPPKCGSHSNYLLGSE